MDKQNINTKYTRIHTARRLKHKLKDCYVHGNVTKYTKVIKEYNQIVRELSCN